MVIAQHIAHTPAVYRSLWLYRLVFISKQRWGILLVLVVAFLVQPLHQIYADETESNFEPAEAITTDQSPDLSDHSTETAPVTEESASEVFVLDEDTIEIAPAAETEGDFTINITETADQNTTEDSSTIEDNLIASTDIDSEMQLDAAIDIDSETGSGTTLANTEDSFASVAGMADDLDALTASDDQPETEVEQTITDVVSGHATDGASTELESSIDIASTDVSEGTISAADEEAVLDSEATQPDSVPVEVAATLINDENRFQFSATQCVSVGNGSYYCSNRTVGDGLTEEAVFVAPGESGFQDIWLRTTREIRNISNSQYDDGAPHFDSRSETVVWHSNRDGRWQIVSHDVRRGTTEILTNNSVNDMQPTRSGEVTVWQRWQQDAWQIVVHQDGEERILTNTTQHNIAPSINGQYVIWNTTNEQGERRIAVYDLETDLVSYIADTEGGRISNPRFVLVYDTTLPSGDVITQGFDPETGLVTPLSAIPAAPPPDIPSPDPLEETRALLQYKQQQEGEVKTVSQPEADSKSSAQIDADIDIEPVSSTGTASTTALDDIDLASPTEPLALSEYDLVVTPYVASTTDEVTTDTAHTEDSETD